MEEDYILVGFSAANPVAEYAHFLKSGAVRHSNGGDVGFGNVDVELAQSQPACSILVDHLHRFVGKSLTLICFADEYAQFGSVVDRVEIEKIYGADGVSGGIEHNHEAQLAIGVDIGG